MISYDEFASVEMKIGEIVSVEVVEHADKLLKLSVDFGPKPSVQTDGLPDHPAEQDGLGEERDIRQIISGIREFFEDPQSLVGTKCPFVTNLQHRTIRGFESEGMILAASTGDGTFALLIPSADLPVGTRLA